MVLRLFVPPGEGQHELVPQRPEPLGANATLQYAVCSSTALAVAYTSFAARFRRRVTPRQPISRTVLFMRSSATLGLWAGVLGGALNWYYHSSFASVVLAQKVHGVRPWELYKKTEEYTVDDGMLAGAAMGLAAAVPTLILRRPAIPVWMRLLGPANIGACAGVLGAHGCLQYAGERQKAYERLGKRLQRRSLVFWSIFWDKELMARLNPLWQHYVRHQGIWYTQMLPDHVFEQAEESPQPSEKAGSAIVGSAAAAEQQVQEEPPFYTKPFDYAEDLRQIDFDTTLSEMERLEMEKAGLLAEAEYLLFVNAQKEHAYCHLGQVDGDERQCRLQEIHLIEIAYNRLRSAAHAIDMKLVKWHMSLRHKAIWDQTGTWKSDVRDWMPRSSTINFVEHRPSIAISEMERFASQIAAEVRRFEELSVDTRYTPIQRERWRKDLEDGRILLKAADRIAFELRQDFDGKRRSQGAGSREDVVKDDQRPSAFINESPQRSLTEEQSSSKTLGDLPEPHSRNTEQEDRGPEKNESQREVRRSMGSDKP
ncbi:hypothetical protein ACN47E_005682 [Coniothyrium glycines]